MEIDKCYLVGIHRYSFKAGEPAEIIGIASIKPNKDTESRLCYHIRFSDNSEDYIPIREPNYKVITFKDILAGDIPKVME